VALGDRALLAQLRTTAQSLQTQLGPLLAELSTPGGLAQAKDLAQSLTALGGRYLEGLAEGAGRALATSLVLRLSGGDEAVGQVVGGIAGTVLFNVALTYATDGAYLAAKAVLPGLVALVTATRDAVLVAEDLARWLPQVLRGLEVAGGRLKGAVAERVQRVLDTLKPLVERLLAMATKEDDPAASTAPHGAGSGAARRPGRPRDRGGQRIRQRNHQPGHDTHRRTPPETEEQAVRRLKVTYEGRIAGLQTRVVGLEQRVNAVPSDSPDKYRWIADIVEAKETLGILRGLAAEAKRVVDFSELDGDIQTAWSSIDSLDNEIPPLEPRGASGETAPTHDKSPSTSRRPLRSLNVKATTPVARLIENPAIQFPYDMAREVDEAQTVMNDLYRAGSTYGDGSSAFMAMKEQSEGGVGHSPRMIAGGTLHYEKCEGYIVGLGRLLHDLAELPEEAKQRIAFEIQKMKDAVRWATEYAEGLNPSVPQWARQWKNQLEPK